MYIYIYIYIILNSFKKPSKTKQHHKFAHKTAEKYACVCRSASWNTINLIYCKVIWECLFLCLTSKCSYLKELLYHISLLGEKSIFAYITIISQLLRLNQILFQMLICLIFFKLHLK